MSAQATISRMARKKTVGAQKPPENPESSKVVIYLEVDPLLKELMDRVARLHNRRLTGECIQALQDHLAKVGLWPPQNAASS